MKTILKLLTVLMLSLAAVPATRAFEHPGIPLTASDLDDIKAKIDAGAEPWASVYASMASYVSSDYVMAGPFATVSRTPNVNNGAWKGDMGAIYDLARMWYFTGNTAYAQKAHDVLIAWAQGTAAANYADKHTSFGGAEGFMDMGDYSYRMFGAADILRGTWPGWTQADTDACKSYFLNVFWWAAAVPDPLRSANQGAMQLPIGLGVAVFCDDQEKFDLCLQAFRADAAGGLADTLPNGEMGDTGRDQGHAYGQLQHLTWIAEVFWKQGVDVYSEHNNRLLHVGEFFARYNLSVNTPYIPFGTTYDLYPGIVGAGYFNGLDMMNTLHGAYVVRKGMSAPYITQYRDRMGEWADSIVFRKTADTSTATPPATLVVPSTNSLTTGLTSVDIGGATPAGSASYSAGTWTVNGAGPTITYGASDTCQFAYMPRTGDCTVVAKVTSSPSSRAGVMIRESLAANAGMMACFVDGTQIWADLRSYTASSHGGSVQIHDFVSVPYWVKLERVGKRITAFHSPDGASWTEIQIGDYDNMGSAVYIGLCQASYTGGTLNTATFSDVRITGGDNGEAAKIPAAPLAVYGSPGNRQVSLRWLESFGATSYNVKRATTSGGPYTTIATVTGSSYADLGAANGSTYYYVVSAVNSAGESGNCTEDTVVPPSLQFINVARNGVATASAQKSPGERAGQAFDGFTWSKWYNNNLGTTGWLQYDLGAGNALVVQRYDLSSANDAPGRDPKNWQFQGSNNGTSWTTLDTRTGETFATRYLTKQYSFSNSTAYRYYRLNITANNGDASALQLSELALMSTAITAPPAPAAPAASALSHQQIRLTWTASTSADSYNVKRATTPGGPYTTFAIPTGTSFMDSGLSLSTSYYYVVSAVNYAGESVASTQVSATTQTLPAPTNLTATPGNQQVTLSWDVVSQATGYYVKRATSTGGPYTTIASPTTTSYIDTAVTQGVTYYYVVSALDASVESANSAEANAGPLYFSPTAHLKFDESSGTTAADSSGNGWNGTLVNGPTWTTGKINHAVSLDGTNDHVTLPVGVVSGLTDFSISVWVNLTTVTNWQRIFDFGTGTGTYMTLIPQAGSGGPVRFAITTGGNTQEEGINGTAALSPGAWRHVVVTLSGTTGTLYVNGIQVGQNTAMTLTPTSLGSTTLNYIGKSQFSADPYLNGLVDDFQIYNRALSADEVAALAHPAGDLITLPAAPANLMATTGSAQVALAWTASPSATSYTVKRATTSGGPYTTIAMDVTATGYTNTGLTNGSTYYYVVSAVNAGGEGPNTAYVGATLTPVTPTGVNATEGNTQVSLGWTASSGATSYNVKRATASGGPYTTVASPATTSYTDTAVTPYVTYYYVLSAVNAGGESADSSQVNATPFEPPAVPSGLSATPGIGQVAVSWTASAQATSYNVKRATTSGGPYTTVASPATTSYTDTSVVGGAIYYYVVSALHLTAESADSAQVSATPSISVPVAYLKFDESSGTTAADGSGNGWNGTLVNSPTWTTGKTNNAVSLSGTNQYATLPAGVVNGLNNFTIAAWVKLPAVSTWQRIFDFGTGTSNYMFLTPKSGGAVRFAIKTTSTSEQVINGAAALPTGVWKHVVVTLSGSTGTLYVDGVAVGQNTSMTLTPSSLGNTTQNYIGKSQFADPYLNGLVDEFQIYNRALSSTEIAALTQPPATPTGLTATAGNAQVALNWTSSGGAASYNVKRSLTSGGPYTTVGTATATNYTDTGLTNGTPYFYVVSASNVSGEGAASAEASATPVPPIADWELVAPPVVVDAGGNVSIPIAVTVTGRTYQLQRRQDLTTGTWLNIGSPQTGDGGTVILNDAASGLAKCFYRVLLQ